jgi:hypothetical protein
MLTVKPGTRVAATHKNATTDAFHCRKKLLPISLPDKIIFVPPPLWRMNLSD